MLHNKNAMNCILAYLFHCSLSLQVSLCLLLYLLYLLYLLSFLSLLYFHYDWIARQGPRRFPPIHEHRRFATDHRPPD